jgi:signal transduction histidine kinase
MTIRRKLLLLLLAVAAVPVMVAGVLTYRGADDAMRQMVKDLHARSARAEAEHARSYVEAFGRDLAGALRYSDPGKMSDGERHEFVVSVFLRHDRIAIAALLGPDGKVEDTEFVDHPESYARRDPQYRFHDTVAAEEAQEFYRRAREVMAAPPDGRSFAVSEPYVTGKRRRVAVAVVASAVARASPLQQLSLAAELTLTELSDRLQDLHRQDQTLTFFLDGKGMLFLHPDPAVQQARPTFAGHLPAAVRPASAGSAVYEADGVESQAAFSPVPDLPWVAVVARPRSVAMAPLHTLAQTSAAVLVFALVMVTVMAPLVSRALARPIAELAEGAAQFTRGNLQHRIHLHRRDELGDLARAFNEMGRSLEATSGELVRFNERLQEQVEERTRELKQAQQQLLRSQRLAAVGDLAAGLAHEVNNPLCAIVGNAQLLLAQVDTRSTAAGMLKDTLDAALRITDIVKDLRALSETQRAGLARVDLPSLLERVVQQRHADLESQSVDVQRRYGEGLAPVLGHEPALRDVFGHLISNALNAMDGRQERKISLATSVIDGYAVKVEVSDTGRGIPREHLERIFNPFFTTKQRWSGKGLALSICHRIVENHGGKISVQSEEGVGTTVTVVLPAAPPEPHLR